MAVICVISLNSVALGANYVTVVEVKLIGLLLRKKFTAKEFSFDNMTYGDILRDKRETVH